MIHWISLKYDISKPAAYRQLRAERGLGPDEYLASCRNLGPVYIGGMRDFSDQELERLRAPRNYSFDGLKKRLCPQILKYVPHYSRHSAVRVARFQRCGRMNSQFLGRRRMT
jgi:hypothetical protein